ncbi:hypothetical protein M407DRAFT_11349 [Tulasnella calospora MUT 4182]|uniref:Uncharacterized protein n=1 Tax=Tulasnella calospora MUT 4182 TaxID=1051891 RepID=A0A0C3LDK2_9AGAM|nr:hypothetical protein M407DRAFT_11349 [Tulasnella calospora MUT 4182]
MDVPEVPLEIILSFYFYTAEVTFVGCEVWVVGTGVGPMTRHYRYWSASSEGTGALLVADLKKKMESYLEEEAESALGIEVEGYAEEKRRMWKSKDLVEKMRASDPTGSDVVPVMEQPRSRHIGALAFGWYHGQAYNGNGGGPMIMKTRWNRARLNAHEKGRSDPRRRQRSWDEDVKKVSVGESSFLRENYDISAVLGACFWWTRAQMSRSFSALRPLFQQPAVTTPPTAAKGKAKEEDGAFYYGPLTKTFQSLKVFSLSSLGLCCSVSPFIYLVDANMATSARTGLVVFAITTSSFSTSLVGWLARPYAIAMRRLTPTATSSITSSADASTPFVAPGAVEILTKNVFLQERRTKASLRDGERVAPSLTGLSASPLLTEASSDSFWDVASLQFFSPHSFDESSLTVPANGSSDPHSLSPPSVSGFLTAGEANTVAWITKALSNADGLWGAGVPPTNFAGSDKRTGFMDNLFAGISPSTSLAEISNDPPADLNFTSEWWGLFSESAFYDASVTHSIPSVPDSAGGVDSSSDSSAEGLHSLLELLDQVPIIPLLEECETGAYGAEMEHRDASPACPLLSSENDSNASKQSPILPTPRSTPPPTPSPSLTSASSAPASPSPPPQIIDFEKRSPIPSNEAPATFNFVFDLKTFGEEDRCKCGKKIKKKNRHWLSCPSNPNKPRLPCPYCPKSKNKMFRGGSARANLQKHVKRYHPGDVIPRVRRK